MELFGKISVVVILVLVIANIFGLIYLPSLRGVRYVPLPRSRNVENRNLAGMLNISEFLHDLDFGGIDDGLHREHFYELHFL